MSGGSRGTKDAPSAGVPAGSTGSRMWSGRWSVASSQLSRLIAVCAGCYGFLTMLRGIRPAHRHEDWLGLGMHVGGGPVGAAITVGLGAAIVLVAHGLARRKRRAWLTAVVALVGLALQDVFEPKEFVSLTVSVLLLVLLLIGRSQFTGRTEGTMRGSAAGAALAVLIMGLLLGMVGLHMSRQLTGDTGAGARLLTVLRGFVGISGPVRFVAPHHQMQFQLTLVVFTVLVIGVAAYLSLRSAEPAPSRTAAERDIVAGLLASHGGRDSLGYFALRQDKSVVVSQSGKSALTYRVIAGVAMVSADPLGDPDAWPSAISNFLLLCQRYSWVPAVLGCSAEGALAFRRQGLQVLEIGDEAVVDVESFALDGRPMRNARQMVNRVRRNGYYVEFRRMEELTATERDSLQACADRWRVGRVERGYSMALGRLGGPGCVLAIAIDTGPDGSPRPRALLQFVPWGKDGWSLDQMRRDPQADPGMNDLLIVSALQRASEFGITKVSLNFAMMRQAFAQGERLGAGWAARGWAWLLRQVSRWFQLESLYRFNAKFGPRWVPRYLCFRGIAALPRVAYAAMEAEAFVQRPAALQHLRSRTMIDGGRLVPAPRTGKPPILSPAVTPGSVTEIVRDQ